MRLTLVLSLCLAAGLPGAARAYDEGGAGDEGGADEAPLVPMATFFHGAVTRVGPGREIELRYDFEDPAQLADFEAAVPFQAVKDVVYEIERGQVHVKGTGSMRHKAVFQEWIEAEARLTPARNRDLGFAVTEQRESRIFTLYCVYDRYFGRGDGVFEPQNMIVKFISSDLVIQGRKEQEWRYCGSRGQKPEIRSGQTYAVRIRREGLESFLSIDDWKSKGKEAGRDLTSQMVALYTHTGDFKADDLVVRGSLDPTFVEANRLDLTPTEPVPEEPVVEAAPELPADEMERLQARIRDYPDRTKPLELAKMIRDTALPEAVREQAAQRAVAAGSRRIVPYLLDCLGSDDETSRMLGFEVFKEVEGKTFGYRPDASEEARARFMKKINEHVAKNARAYE